MTIEIFSHDLSVRADGEADDVFIISGKGWDEEPFSLYIGIEDAQSLLWQLGFFIND